MPGPSRNEYSTFETPLQEISFKRLGRTGLVLDVGGGGEGIVSRIEGSRVCAIDINLNEIREAQIYGSSPQWLACSGESLPFRTAVFETATIWFSLDYVADWKMKRAIMREVFRVLRKEGSLSLMSSKIICREAKFVLRMRYTLPDGSVYQTGYGVKGNQGQTADRISDIAEQTGFHITNKDDNGHWFYIDGVRE
jgi:ubiquinone/menaquinone biosynthesis C-methylase UbiE